MLGVMACDLLAYRVGMVVCDRAVVDGVQLHVSKASAQRPRGKLANGGRNVQVTFVAPGVRDSLLRVLLEYSSGVSPCSPGRLCAVHGDGIRRLRRR